MWRGQYNLDMTFELFIPKTLGGCLWVWQPTEPYVLWTYTQDLGETFLKYQQEIHESTLCKVFVSFHVSWVPIKAFTVNTISVPSVLKFVSFQTKLSSDILFPAIEFMQSELT